MGRCIMQIQNTGSSLWAGSKKTEQTLKRTSQELKKILERLSSSKRINRASDDAAGLAISEEFQSKIRGYKAATQNIEDSISAFNIADGAGDNVSSILQRQRELAIKASNATLSVSDREFLNKEYQELNLEANRIADSSLFNRQGVASGDELASGEAVIQAGLQVDEQIKMPQIDLKTAISNLSETSLLSIEDAVHALQSIDKAITSINEQRTVLGSAFNRLESSVNDLSVAIINTQAAESVIRDQDMAEGLVALVRQQLLQEGSQRAFARFKTINTNHMMGLIG